MAAHGRAMHEHRTERPVPRCPAAEDTALEDGDPHCLPERELAALLASLPWRRLAVVGDSIAAGIGDPVPGYRDRSWAERLARGLAPQDGSGRRDAGYLNLGVPGLRASEVRRTQLARALTFAPDLAMVAAGANDALQRSFEPDRVAREVDGIVGPLAARGCCVVTFGLLDLSRTGFVPDGMRAGLRRRLLGLNEVSRTAAARHGGVYVDFFDHPALGDALFSADMIHPNRRGHAHIAAAVAWALAGHAARHAPTPERGHDGADVPDRSRSTATATGAPRREGGALTCSQPASGRRPGSTGTP